MYKSPIELIVTDIEYQVKEKCEEACYEAVLHYIPNVDREELIRALQYDRQQYEQGYRDAVRDKDLVEVVHGQWEVVHGVITPGGDPLLRCPRCRSRESEHCGGIECNRAHWNYCPICGMTMDGGNDNG